MDEKKVTNLNETYHEMIREESIIPSDGTTPGGTLRVCKNVIFYFSENSNCKPFYVTKI
ncbi:MAG: hypothetical protein NT178_17115 [Proteobacteria bacterium]|nr:hypothetical protein [Pseudomonadota bacterium]